jgi:hypothetical protein
VRPVSRAVIFIAAAVTLVLIATAGGYGYHRDELYFIAAGQHLDWAYADQGIVTPLIARAMTEIAPDSLTVLRIPSAFAAGATVLLTGLLAREFGVGLMNKPLPAFLAVGLLLGVAIAGPRRLLRNPYVWGGALIALLIWSPWIAWQQANDWPQIDVSRGIREGGSTSSEPRWAIVPFQLLLIGPLLAPVWIAGLVRLLRDPVVRHFRFLAWSWVALAVVFVATGGKPYYMAGLLPALLGAGAVPVDRWLARGRVRARRALDNDELGTPVSVCRDTRRPWRELWPTLRHLN